MSEIVVQAGTTVVIAGTVTQDGAPLSLAGQTVEGALQIGGVSVAAVGAVTDAAAGAFTLTLDDAVTATWPPGQVLTLRMARVSGADRFALGVATLRVI